MSATGKAFFENSRKSEFYAAPARSPAAATGFTLIELLVILGVLSLIAGIIFPSVERAIRSQTLVTASLKLELAVRSARARAIGQAQTVRLSVTPDRHGFVTGGKVTSFPPSTLLTMPPGGTVFFADGSSTGAVITLSDQRFIRRIDVHAPTGAIERKP